MNIHSLLYKLVLDKILKNYSDFIDIAHLKDKQNFVIERPKNPQYGHFATNCALSLSKILKKNPDEIAMEIIPQIQHQYIKKISYINKFINFTLSEEFFKNLLDQILLQQDHYGFISEKSDNFSQINNLQEQNEEQSAKKREKINLEFVSANPTGPMHIGHLRGAIIGDCIANLLKKFNFDVTTEYLINDFGSQIVTLTKSVIYKALDLILNAELPKPKEFYPGNYLNNCAKEVSIKYKDSLLEFLKLDLSNQLNLEEISNLLEEKISQYQYFDEINKYTVAKMLELIKNDLSRLGITHDIFFSERKMIENGEVEQTLALLEQNNLLEFTTLERPLGIETSEAKSSENNKALVFKSNLFGDENPRVVRKNNGELTYFASDLSYMKNKINRDFNKLIYLLGFDHIGYVDRIKSGVAAFNEILSKENPNFYPIEVEVKTYQMVNFLNDNVPVRMSKRAGNFDTVGDVLDLICQNQNDIFAKGVLKFTLLSARDETAINFDLKLVTERSNDNIFFYIQYAYARINSILKNAKEQSAQAEEIIENKTFDWSLLNYAPEFNIIIHLSLWPYVAHQALITLDLSKIVKYLEDLARLIHEIWNVSIDSIPYKIINLNNSQLTATRSGILLCAKIVIENCAQILGITLTESIDKLF